MLWIAVFPSPSPTSPSPLDPDAAPDLQTLTWWALQFSPRVCQLEEAVLVEVEASTRLFGGKRLLLNRIRGECADQGVVKLAAAPTALAALALGRKLEGGGDPVPAMACAQRDLTTTLDAMPLAAVSAVSAHEVTLSQLGCRTLGDVRRLPRGGLSRRFAGAILDAMDRAYGLRPDAFTWVTLPEQFCARLEFLGRIEVAEGLMFGANRLLLQLKAWLGARQCGIRAVVLHWEHDLQRRSEAAHGSLEIRTAETTRDMQHLARLMAEQLGRVTLNAPVVAIRLEASQVEALPTASASLLVEDRVVGESFQQLVERLSARLGPENVTCGGAVADHRPQRALSWESASTATRRKKPPALPGYAGTRPPWLLRKPMRLAVKQDRPIYQGALTLLAGPERIEAGWWEAAGDLTQRDYFIAESEYAGLVWIYRERIPDQGPGWFLHGIYG